MKKDLDLWYLRRGEFKGIELPSNKWCLLIYSVIGLVADVAIAIHKETDFDKYKDPNIATEQIRLQIEKDYPNAVIKSICFTSTFERI